MSPDAVVAAGAGESGSTEYRIGDTRKRGSCPVAAHSQVKSGGYGMPTGGSDRLSLGDQVTKYCAINSLIPVYL